MYRPGVTAARTGGSGPERVAFWGTLASPTALGPSAASLRWEEAGVTFGKRRGPRHRASGPQGLPRSAPTCIPLWDFLNGPCKAQELAGQSLGPLLGCTPGYPGGTAFTAGSDRGKARPAPRGGAAAAAAEQYSLLQSCRGAARAARGAAHLKGRGGRAVSDSRVQRLRATVPQSGGA